MIHSKISACEGVYEPREDSFLLEESVLRYASGRFLDMGTGSGIQGIAAAKAGCDVIFSDIDERALRCAEKNARTNGVAGEFVKSDMFENISGLFDTIAFNPPYLIGTEGEGRELALDGGINGRTLIDRFISGFRDHLRDGGSALLLESSLNRYEDDVRAGKSAIVGNKRFFFEEIVVIRMRK